MSSIKGLLPHAVRLLYWWCNLFPQKETNKIRVLSDGGCCCNAACGSYNKSWIRSVDIPAYKSVIRYVHIRPCPFKLASKNAYYVWMISNRNFHPNDTRHTVSLIGLTFHVLCCGLTFLYLQHLLPACDLSIIIYFVFVCCWFPAGASFIP